MLTILYGENDYEISVEKQKIIRNYLEQEGTNMGLEKFDHEINSGRLWQSITSQPFLVAEKLIVLNYPSKSSELSNFILEKLDDVPKTTHLLLLEDSLDKRTAYYKEISKNKHARLFSNKNIAGLTDWLLEYAKEKNLNLSRSHVQRLLQRAGEDQRRLASEIDKLAPLGEVSNELIDELVQQDPGATVFELLDNLAAGKLQESHKLYEDLRKQQIETNVILSMLAWQMQNILLIAFAGGKSDQEIAKDAGMNPYVVGKTRALARKLGTKKIAHAVSLLADYEQDIKTGKLHADQGIKLIISKLAGLFS